MTDYEAVLERIRRTSVYNVSVASETGPVLVIDDFLTADECTRIIELAHAQGLERSTVVGGETEGGSFKRELSDVRTSSNTWCMEPCYSDPLIMELDARIAAMVGVPSRLYSEHFQMLHYAPGQYYHEHSDHIDSFFHTPGSFRTFTVFIYLNDVPAGGETEFVSLGVKVVPKAGRVAIWPNIIRTAAGDIIEHPDTHHRALPVKAGEKFAANKWVHAADFITPWLNGVAP